MHFISPLKWFPNVAFNNNNNNNNNNNGSYLYGAKSHSYETIQSAHADTIVHINIRFQTVLGLNVDFKNVIIYLNIQMLNPGQPGQDSVAAEGDQLSQLLMQFRLKQINTQGVKNERFFNKMMCKFSALYIASIQNSIFAREEAFQLRSSTVTFG